jgi:histone deacetylase 1/2
MRLPDADRWLVAAQQEMKAHDDNKTWTLVHKPPNAKVIEGRWVFTKKRTPDSTQHKARFVAKGFSQTAGVDYDETYAAVLSLSALRLLIILAVTFGWRILQRDFKTAYLNALLLIPIYMRQPAGFEKQGGGQHMVCLLHKALYGLKQAGRAWQHALFDLLRDENFQQSKKEPCIWFKRAPDTNTITIIAIYVDDLLITGNNQSEIQRITKVMGDTFKMKDLGEIK